MAESKTPTPEEKPAAPADTSAQELNAKIDAAQSKLAQLAAKQNSSATTTAVVGAILLVFIIGYFTYGYLQIAPILKPEQLVGFLSEQIDQNLPKLRKEVEKQVDQSAPKWAEQLSTQVKSAIPEVREQLEDYVIDQTDAMIDEVQLMTEEQFREILTDNRDMLTQGFEELGTSEEMSKESIAALETALEKQLQGDMRQQAAVVLETLNMLNEKIDVLARGKLLNREQRLEQRALMILRRLALAEADPELADRKMNSATKGIDEPKSDGAEKKKDDGEPKKDENSDKKKE